MATTATGIEAAARRRPARFAEFARRNPTMLAGLVIIAAMAAVAIASPLIAPHPLAINPIDRLKPPSAAHPFGTDMLGRDIFARTVHGGRISLLVGFSVAALTTVFGTAIGLVAGYLRRLDAFVMRVMDGLMAVPGILLAIAFMAIASASVMNVVVAIAIAEVPRMVRLVRSVVLTIREQPYIEAAVSIGTRTPKLILRHILPNTIAPMTVQATYVCASAMITEAILSFLGAGTPPEIPSWGNIMAEGREFFELTPWIILFPGLFLAATVLAVNLVGDGLRDTLDPRIARRM
ncbi:MAG TPA: ABC transporter permease [Stellaceae bacterium]|nr:ABC transporter permease [Stellaceae bacterium]